MNSSYDKESRMWAAACHFSALFGTAIPFGHIIIPLLIWSVKKEEFPFVEEHGRESLNFQISMTIYLIIAGILCFMLIGIPMLVVLGIFELVMVIIAGLRAFSGEWFRYPFTIKFL